MSEKMDKKKVAREEMAEVTGGALKQSSMDSKFLGALTGNCDRYGTGMIYWSTSVKDELRNAWAKVGVRVVLENNEANQYFINDRQVTQEEAMAHAQNVTGKTLRREEWDW